MNRRMLRGIAWLLCALLAALPGMAAAQGAGDSWICEKCKYENLSMGRFCEECGAARPTGEWTCSVCGRVNDRNFCEECGAGRDAASAPSTPAPTRVPVTTSAPTPAAAHAMKGDTPKESDDSLHLKVFGTSMERRNIRSIVLRSSLEDAPAGAIDVSRAGDRSVLLWFVSDGGDMSDMFLGANGKIAAPASCDGLFSYYINCAEIHLNDCLDTSETTSMREMFSCCWDLKVLDGVSFDTSRVTDMNFMFSHLSELEALDLSSFDTSATLDFGGMFSSCESLSELDISSFELRSDAHSFIMFDGCDSLPASAYAHIADRLTTPAPTPKPTPKPAATPYVYYPELSRGSEGSAVRALQEQLICLGYLAAGEADGSYGRRTAEAVHRFKQNNGLSDYGSHYATECVATGEMQNRLYSGAAVFNAVPDFPLTFPSGSYAEWYKESGNKLKIRFQVTNISTWQSVTAFRVQAYATDVWGCEIYGDSVYYETTKRSIAPSDYGWSTYLYLPDRDEIDKVYARISEVKLSDGTTLTNTDYEYSEWTITYN